MKKTTIFFLGIIFILGCKKENRFDCIKSTGKIVKEERTLPSFNIVNLCDNINVIFTQDTGNKIILEAGRNLIASIKTQVINNELTVTNDNKCNWVRSYKKEITLYISQTDVEEITNYSYGNISNEGVWNINKIIIHQYGNGEMNFNFNVKELMMDMNHLSGIKISGMANTFTASILGLGTLDSRSLNCKVCDIVAEGQNNCYVYADSLLHATIKDQGNIYYSGNPKINLEDRGKGELIKE